MNALAQRISVKRRFFLLLASLVAMAVFAQATRAFLAMVQRDVRARPVSDNASRFEERPSLSARVRLEVLGNDANAEIGSLIERSENSNIKFVGCGGFL